MGKFRRKHHIIGARLVYKTDERRVPNTGTGYLSYLRFLWMTGLSYTSSLNASSIFNDSMSTRLACTRWPPSTQTKYKTCITSFYTRFSRPRAVPVVVPAFPHHTLIIQKVKYPQHSSNGLWPHCYLRTYTNVASTKPSRHFDGWSRARGYSQSDEKLRAHQQHGVFL